MGDWAMPESIAAEICRAAIREERAAEFLTCLFDGGSATVDALTRKLILVTGEQLKQMGGDFSDRSDLPEGLGKADWIYGRTDPFEDPLSGMHIPCCSVVKSDGLTCGNGPLTGEAIETGDCGEHLANQTLDVIDLETGERHAGVPVEEAVELMQELDAQGHDVETVEVEYRGAQGSDDGDDGGWA